MKFSYVNPTKIQFGQGQIASLSALIPADQTVLVVYGGGSIKKNGVYDLSLIHISEPTRPY